VEILRKKKITKISSELVEINSPKISSTYSPHKTVLSAFHVYFICIVLTV